MVPGTPKGADGDSSGAASAVGLYSEGTPSRSGLDADPEVDEGGGPDLLLAE
jgi:hypothetical protein